MKINEAEEKFTDSWVFKIGLVILGGLAVLLFYNQDSFLKNLKTSTAASQNASKSCDESKSIQETKNAVVRVSTGVGEGTGFIIKPDYIITNYHVVQDTEFPKIVFSDNTQIVGKVFNWDEETDLAVIKISKENLKSIPFGESDNLSQGQTLIGIGFPLGQNLPGEATVTKGTYAAKRPVEGAGLEYIQVDASLNPGNSGSPIITTCGEVVGVYAMKISDTEGLKFAISSKTAKAMSDSLIATGPKIFQAKVPQDREDSVESSPEMTVALYYYYISARQLDSAWELLTPNFQRYVQGYDHWSNGYNTTLNVYLLDLGPSEIANNVVKVELASVDDINGQVVYKLFRGTYTLVQQGGAWKIDSSNIIQAQ